MIMNPKQYLEKYLIADTATALQMDFEWQEALKKLPKAEQTKISKALSEVRLAHAEGIIRDINCIADELNMPKVVSSFR